MTFKQEFPNAKINNLRYFTTWDTYDHTPNWSRRYEWEYAYNVAKHATGSVLNAACGTNPLHATFSNRLSRLVDARGGVLYNCDMQIPNVTGLFENFFIHDILEPLPQRYDTVICVSTVEDFLDPKIIERATLNLLRHTLNRLVITADIYDRVRPEWFADMVGEHGRVFPEQHALTGATSSYPQHEFEHLKVMLLDITHG